MKLNKLTIERRSYGQHKGQLRGMVQFSGVIGEISIILNEDQTEKILGICAESLTATAQEAGKIMTAEIIECQPVLEQS